MIARVRQMKKGKKGKACIRLCVFICSSNKCSICDFPSTSMSERTDVLGWLEILKWILTVECKKELTVGI